MPHQVLFDGVGNDLAGPSRFNARNANAKKLKPIVNGAGSR
jgi:hypothetical protein